MSDASRWLDVLVSTDYLTLVAIYSAFMTFLWWLRRPLRNAGMVDLGWPCLLVTMAVYFFVTADGWWPRSAVICGMFAICGLRFIIGWTVRVVRDREDRRWAYWRRHWQEGNGPLGIRSEDVNFFIFYHMQSLITLFVGAAPLAMASHHGTVGFHPLEIAGIALWLTSYALENVADFQLDRSRRRGNAGVCRAGLWAFCRTLVKTTDLPTSWWRYSLNEITSGCPRISMSSAESPSTNVRQTGAASRE